MGYDPTLVYVREQKTLEIERSVFPKHLKDVTLKIHKVREDSPYYFSDRHSIYVGFCGKLYSAFNSLEPLFWAPSAFSMSPFQVDIGKVMQEHGEYLKVGKYMTFFSQKRLAAYLENVTSNPGVDIPVELFRDWNAPIFMFKGSDVDRQYVNLTINPTLADIGFQAKIDPYTAYQDLGMFLGGVMGSIEEPHVASDKELLHARGFDQYSFKQGTPGAKKARRKENRKRKRGVY
jgi:hypothetical protein